MPSPTLEITLTWTPAETGITEIDSYTIMRATDGGAQASLIRCPVLRDFLGGIIGVQNCTTVPSIPTDDDTGSVYDKVTNEDAPVTYVDTTVAAGHQYCYQIVANPMGNNQSSNQGPPSKSNILCSVTTIAAPILTAAYDVADAQIVLLWELPPGQFVLVTQWDVYKSINGGAFVHLGTQSASTLSIGDSSVSAGNTYTYYVTYTAYSAVSPQSTPVSISI